MRIDLEPHAAAHAVAGERQVGHAIGNARIASVTVTAATATSASIVSGRTVATTTSPPPSVSG
jgi:hypothetical protein